MLKRRHLLAASGGLAAANIARAATRTIGWVSPESRETTAPFFEAFHAALRVDLKDDEVRILERYAPKGPDDIAAAVADLERQGVALIVTQGAATVWAARVAKKPIVFGFSGDPIVAGVAQSLARPGGNATGMTFMSVELMAKRIDFLRMAAPASRKLALLSNASHFGEEREIAACKNIVEPAGVELQVHRIKGIDEIAPTIDRALQEGQALLVLSSSTMVRAAPAMAAQCLVRKAPLVSGWASIAQAGGLMTYGPNLQAAYRRLSTYVVRVLGGASPADLPIEQPTTLELVLNRRTATAIDVRFPDALIPQAEEIIQ